MRLLALWGFVLLGLGGTGTPAWADGAPVGSDVAVAQTLGERELTVTVRRTDGAPAPLQVDIINHVGSPLGTLRLSAVPAGARATSTATIDLGIGPSSALLRVDRFGYWELEIDDGSHTARIPFSVPERVVPAWERAVYGGFVAAGIFLIGGLVLAARGGKLVLVPAAGLVAALSVAVTAALLSPTIPAKSTQDNARPPVNLAVTADNPTTGSPVTLALSVTDGATGRPVDDIVLHHGALIHLAIVGPTGNLAHVHPVRTAPGDYRAQFTPTEPGRYVMAAEVARVGGGTQQVRADITVTGDAVPLSKATPGTVTVGPLVAGDPATLTADFTGKDDLQPWLGMRGHLIVVGPLPTQDVWAHVHAMTTATAGTQPDETVAAYPAKVSFTFTFPRPGRYLAWFQAERDFAILTIPTTLDVEAQP
ncbi:hypothetical protein [Actinokineospora diospyrosa]|uniref:Secreted protein n=2 Tax=Actinokineospora diospyrosa TaxID=103728 RepID=A0ABT1IF44_9PSEU|nr:hypothetical protein [Actinokineospora diospyrosa]MCP2271269.1 hypothetical protein [Actinokineospora diospyrosa]